MSEKKYKVKGTHKGRKVNSVVYAYTARQAKLRAGYDNGFGGNEMSSFMSNSKVKVKSA